MNPVGIAAILIFQLDTVTLSLSVNKEMQLPQSSNTAFGVGVATWFSTKTTALDQIHDSLSVQTNPVGKGI